MIRWRGSLRTTKLRLAAAGAVAVMTAAAFVALRRHPLATAVAWSALMLASFVGWGGVINWWVSRERRADWGLRAGWGMALSIAVGGYLCIAHMAVRPVLITQVVLGAAHFLGTLALEPPHGSAARRLRALAAKPGVFALLAVGYALAGLWVFANLGDHGFQPSDDPPFYFVLAQKLVASSSLYQPFMARRISTFGGHVYLTATFISVSSVYYLYVVDGGISVVLVVALLFGAIRGSGFKPWHTASLGLVILLLFGLSEVRANTASLFSGVACVLTLYRTIRFSGAPGWPLPSRYLILIAGLACCAILLRTSSAAAVLPLVVLAVLADFAVAAKRPFDRDTVRSILKAGAVLGGAFVLTILPWSVMMKRSCGTFFYPFGHSNLTPGWTFLKQAASFEVTGTKLVELLFKEGPIAVSLFFFLAGTVPLGGRRRHDLLALTVASLVGVLALAREATAFNAQDTARYYFAFVVALALAATATAEKHGSRLALVAMGVGVHFAMTRDTIRDRLETQIRRASSAREEKSADIAAFVAPTTEYRELQDRAPAGATIATAVHEPWRFDFARNEIFALDVLGGMGPKPGWPFARGPEALGDYLRSNGVEYLAWVDFGLPSEFYNRAHWQGHLQRVDSYLAPEARIQLDAMDAIEQLSAKHRVVSRTHGMTLVDLSAPP